MAQQQDVGWDDERPVPLVRPPAPSNGHGAGATASRQSAGTDPGPGSPAIGATPPPQPPRATEFCDEYMLRPQAEKPSRGWRRLLYNITAGFLNLGPSEQELKERELVGRVKAPVGGFRRVAVISRKGGVGKTTTTLMLGHTFASWRGDRVVALDGNPDAGSLGYRVRRETTATVMDLLREAKSIDRYSDVRSFTSQAPTRLEVVASDDDPRISQALGEDDYKLLCELLDHHYNLILLDTGTGILDSATRGILDLADQIIVVMAPSLDGARAASLTLDWLEEHGYDGLVEDAVAVINAVRPRGFVELGRVEEHFALRCREVIQIPWDPHLEAGAVTRLEDLRTASRSAYLRLAAAVADGFPRRGSGRPAPHADERRRTPVSKVATSPSMEPIVETRKVVTH